MDSKQTSISTNKQIKNLINKLEQGQATYEDAHKYAIELGEILSRAYQENIDGSFFSTDDEYNNVYQLLDNGLTSNYNDITKYTTTLQTNLNKQSGLSIKGQKATQNIDKIEGIAKNIVKQDTYEKKINGFGENIVNYSQSVVDDTLKKNLDVQSDIGLSPKIQRVAFGKCCKWCSRLAGTYNYPEEAPDDVFKRHKSCRCMTSYVTGRGVKKTYKDVWSPNSYNSIEYANEVEKRIELTRKADQEQYYKAVHLNPNKKMEINRQTKIVAYKFEKSNYDIYMSKKVHLKPKEMNNIEKSITESLKAINPDESYELPQFIIVGDNDLGSNVLASYNMVTNRILLPSFQGKPEMMVSVQEKNEMINAENKNSTLIHELIHWTDAQKYRKEYGEITAENLKDYKTYINEWSKKKLVEKKINSYNVDKLGKYASKKYETEEYFETYTEYRTGKIGGKG